MASAHPGRIRSLHVACAVSENFDSLASSISLEEVAADPAAWWRYPAGSTVHRIPGFADSATEEATRSMFARGRDTKPEGLAQAREIYLRTPMTDLSAIHAPAFLYWGSEDHLVPVGHLSRWKSALPGPVTTRLYVGEGHDIQYRHWDQILTDVAYLGERVIVTVDGVAELIEPEQATALVEAGTATLGLPAWAD